MSAAVTNPLWYLIIIKHIHLSLCVHSATGINISVLLFVCGHILFLHFRLETETETELNVEVAFSEQALSYRDNHQRLKVTPSSNSPDDKLPVSCIPEHLHSRKGHVDVQFLNTVFIFSEHVHACAIAVLYLYTVKRMH